MRKTIVSRMPNLVAMWGVLLLPAIGAEAQTPPKTGDLLTAVFDGLSGNRGGLHHWDHQSLTTQVFLESPLTFDPQGLAIDHEGRCFLADDDAKPNGQGPGAAVFEIDLITRDITVLTTSHLLASPSAVVFSPTGEMFLVDWDANPNGYPLNTGAVFKLDPNSGHIETFAADNRFGLPFDLAFSPGGKAALVDRSPHLNGASGGGVFLLDPSTGEVIEVFSSNTWIGPEGCFFLDDETLLVSDSFGNAIHRLDLTTGQSTVLSNSNLLSAPRRMVWGPDGNIYVSGHRVTKLDPDTGTVVLVPGLPWGEHVGIAFVPDIPPFNESLTPTATPTPSSTPTATPTVTPINQPPSPPTVMIQPEVPYTFDDLICHATGSIDPEGEPVSYSFRWLKDGIDAGAVSIDESETSFVDRWHTRRDQTWKCIVTASDPRGKSSEGSDEVTIQNSVPTSPAIRILPDNPLPSDGMAVFITEFSTDADGDVVVYLFEWFRLDANGEWQRRPEVSGNLSPFFPGEPEISGLYTAGESWKVEVTPLEARTLAKRLAAKGLPGIVTGEPASLQWVVLPDFGKDGKVDAGDLHILLERDRTEGAAKGIFPFDRAPLARDLIFISPLGWQGKARN